MFSFPGCSDSSVEESCSQEVVFSSFLFRFGRGNSFRNRNQSSFYKVPAVEWRWYNGPCAAYCSNGPPAPVHKWWFCLIRRTWHHVCHRFKWCGEDMIVEDNFMISYPIRYVWKMIKWPVLSFLCTLSRKTLATRFNHRAPTWSKSGEWILPTWKVIK